jgi:DNA processing protein
MSFENKLNKIKNDWPIWKIGRNEVDFPKSLLEVKPAINQLYIRGIWRDDIFDNCAAIVGSRRMTRYGRQVCESVVVKLVSTKKVIVSGFMYGIDTQAHQKTLEFGGITMAVLGGGLNWIYPEENIDLYLQILNSGGLILSEFEPEYKPSLWTFPQRNRIVAGLADEVFVVEAGFKSGSLITANLAYKMGKKVWAVPGMIDSPTSQGQIN